MGEIAARTFVIAFLALYLLLVVALVGWDLRNWLAALSRGSRHSRLAQHLRRLHILPGPRNIH